MIREPKEFVPEWMLQFIEKVNKMIDEEIQLAKKGEYKPKSEETKSPKTETQIQLINQIKL